MNTDKIIKCRDCGEEFVFSAGEQDFYAEMGLDTTPVRCKECRSRRKYIAQHRDSVLYEIVCSKCGKVEAVPFEPRSDRQVYCNECYRATRDLSCRDDTANQEEYGAD